MKVRIEKVSREQEEEVVVRCWDMDAEILEIIEYIHHSNADFIGYEDNKIHRVQLKDIFYFESVDNHVFIYCRNHIFEAKQKLYEIEGMLRGNIFFRTSKSMIINSRKISCVQPYLGGRFEAKLSNGERVVISRRYVTDLKKILGL